MKKISTLLLGALALLSACHEPEYVSPTAQRQGITSLTAIFTSGKFVDQQMAKLEIPADMPERLVIQVPWFYPETSDDETETYMSKVRIQAELQPNCFIEPALTLLDLTKDNWFTYTDAQGLQKRICITGERVKSDKCELQAFSLVEPALAGIVDKTNKKVSIISADDLSTCLAEAQISAHASISPDPATTVLDYNQEQKFTVTAHNGVDKAVYTVVKAVPEKIPAGFNAASMELLFNFDPVSNLGLPAYNQPMTPSMAAINGHLAICNGDGSAPIYINRITGAKIGEVAVGSASVSSITSDEGNHMLLVNLATGGQTVNLYQTTSMTEAPTLFHSFANPATCPVGTKMKVIGNIAEDALIVLPCQGVPGVTETSSIVLVEIRAGTVTSVTEKDLSATGITWGDGAVNIAGVCAASVDAAEGFFESQYEPSNLVWIKNDNTIGASLPSDTSGWGLNPHSLDSKRFNNVTYMALFVSSHFPHWGMGPQLYLYNVNDKSMLTGDNVTNSPALAFANGAVEWYQQADAGVASGDVLIAPTADGFKLYIYYLDHNSGVIGAYAADCIKQ